MGSSRDRRTQAARGTSIYMQPAAAGTGRHRQKQHCAGGMNQARLASTGRTVHWEFSPHISREGLILTLSIKIGPEGRIYEDRITIYHHKTHPQQTENNLISAAAAVQVWGGLHMGSWKGWCFWPFPKRIGKPTKNILGTLILYDKSLNWFSFVFSAPICSNKEI